MQVSKVSSEQRAGLFTLLSRGAEVKISRYLRGNLLYVRGNAVQALTPGCTSRSMWIIRVFFFLILESTLSYVRQLEARVRQLEEENRMLPQVGDFCWWEQQLAARQQCLSLRAWDETSITGHLTLLHLNTQAEPVGNQRHSHLLFISLVTEGCIY